MAREILKKINATDKIYKRFVRKKTPEGSNLLKRRRDEVTNVLRKDKNIYYFHMVYNLNASDMIWRKLNSILGKQSAASVINGLQINGQEMIGRELANRFDDYLINLVDNTESRVGEAQTHVSRYVSETILFLSYEC